MFTDLKEVNDTAWGRYLFAKDFLGGKVDEAGRTRMIGRALACGYEWAGRAVREARSRDPKDLAAYYKVVIKLNDQPMTEKRAVFAEYVTGGTVELYTHPITTFEQFLAGCDEEERSSLPTLSQIKDCILAHEIFHCIEDLHADVIYTRTEKIELFHVWKFRNTSTIRALGEIAAMAFARRITKASFSPFALDVLLYYGYNREMSERIYNEIMQYKQEEDSTYGEGDVKRAGI